MVFFLAFTKWLLSKQIFSWEINVEVFLRRKVDKQLYLKKIVLVLLRKLQISQLTKAKEGL